MIIFSIGDITAIAITRTDRTELHPYLSYTDYIFRVLGDVSITPVNLLTLLDLQIRNYAGHVGTKGIAKIAGLSRSFRDLVIIPASIVTGLPPDHDLSTIILIGPWARRAFGIEPRLSSRVPSLIDLFEGRVPDRFESSSPIGRELLTDMCQYIERPPTGWKWFHQSGSIPLFTALTTIPWARLYPKLFAPVASPDALNASITSIIGSLAGARGVTPAAVRKLLQVK